MEPEIISLKSLGDARGQLVAVEGGQTIPFEIQRVYYLYHTTQGVERGFHAHKALRQVAIAVSGSCEMVLDDGERQTTVSLDNPFTGVLIHPGYWRVMRNFSTDCVLLVLADQHYDESDYIRDYDAFKQWVSQKG